MKKKTPARKAKSTSSIGDKAVSTVADKKVVITPMPTAGRKVLEFEEKLDRQLGGSETKRGRGRPPKVEPPPPPEIDVTIIGQAVEIPFDLWSVSQGLDGLKITHEESILIAKPLKQLLDHYVPQVPEIAWAWISLSAVSYSIMKCRLALIAEIKKQKAQHPSSIGESAGVQGGSDVRREKGSSPPAFPNMEQIKNPVT